MSSGNTTKYLQYAIGEIILVVIGILIALSINNWNQERINQIDKKEMLSKLHSEFKANLNILFDFRDEEDRAFNAMIVLINLVGASEKELAKHNLDSLFFQSFPSNELAFASNAINNILQNGGLNLFKDEKINELLYQWNALDEIRKKRLDKLDNWNNDQLLPYLKSYISFREMDNNANYKWAGKSKVKPNYYPLFQKVEFENLLDNSLWLHQQIIERLAESELLINQIIKLTGSK
jgi:hypothetical protein